MKSLYLRDPRKTVDHSLEKSNLSSFNSTMTIDVQSQISEKFKTFTRWNYRKQIRKKKKSFFERNQSDKQTDNVNMINALLAFTSQIQKKEEEKKKKSNKNVLVMQQLQGIKDQRRERFKKMQNPMHLIQHYMSKQGFKPNEEQNILLDRIVKLKQFMDQHQPIDLDVVLQKIYKIINITVDLNEMRFLILSVLLAAQIAYQCKQMVRSFHFYTQAMIATTCARMNTIKIQCFIQMGKIALEILQYRKAIIFFKKALQYSWKMRDTESELRLYDWLGQAYYYQGQAGYALYYHNRYIQGELEQNNSAARRISFEMLSQFQKTLQNTETENINELFIQYLTLPIANFDVFPPTIVKNPKPNYSQNTSPRKAKEYRNFGADNLPSVKVQMEKIINKFHQFKTEIPNPDLQRNFVSENKYGRPKKDIDFQQSNEYHKIVGISLKKCSPDVFKLPMEQRIQKALSEKRNPLWWQDMVTSTKKERQQRLGQLRDKVKKTHLSYHKYPEERRRSQSLKQEKIKESINKTLLNWIDPQKDQFS